LCREIRARGRRSLPLAPDDGRGKSAGLRHRGGSTQCQTPGNVAINTAPSPQSGRVDPYQRRNPLPGTAPHAAAKAALANYSKSLSNNLAPHGIRVNSVSPGFIETEAAKEFTNQYAAAHQISAAPAREEIIESIGGIPLGQPGTPHDVGELVAFLVSERASYLTGAEYLIDGGSTRTI
jgi:NAD(P)-dependent dehydrogenase (short-subunit alcohol dehydrogenase family)